MKHNVTIDRLRGCCVLVVVCMHAMFFFPNLLSFLTGFPKVLALVGKALPNGYYGVTAFFCTSGFLITTNLLRRYGQVARTDLRAFYVMRFGRIFPPLALLCLVLSLLSLTPIERFHFPPPLSLKDTLLSVATLTYNHYYQRGGALTFPWAVLWSLSIEEVFYLAYPLMAKLTRFTWALVIVLVGLIIYAPVHRAAGIILIFDYFACFDAIAMGALSALAARRFSAHVPRAAAWAIMLTGIAVAGYVYTSMPVTLQFNTALTVLAAGVALILFASQCQPFSSTRPVFYDPIAYFGRLSYEMYLVHMTIYSLLAAALLPWLAPHPTIILMVVLLSVVAVSYMFSRFYAEPLNRWLRQRLLPPGALPAAAAIPVGQSSA